MCSASTPIVRFDFLGLPYSRLDDLVALLGGHDGGPDGFLDVVEDRTYLGGGLFGLIREALDLLRHDREALALLTGFGSLNRGVDRQQVGLLRQGHSPWR